MKPMNNFIHPLDQDAQPCMQLPARGFQWINPGVDSRLNCCRPIGESFNQEAAVVINCLGVSFRSSDKASNRLSIAADL